MYSDEDDQDVTVFWGDECNEYLLENWVSTGKKLYNFRTEDYKASAVEAPDKPWLLPGADVSDWFNFGFTEETWNEFLLNVIKLRQERVLQKEYEIRLTRKSSAPRKSRNK